MDESDGNGWTGYLIYALGYGQGMLGYGYRPMDQSNLHYLLGCFPRLFSLLDLSPFYFYLFALYYQVFAVILNTREDAYDYPARY